MLAQPEVTLFQKSALHCQPTVAKVQWMRRCENYGRQYMNDVTIVTPNGSIRGYLVEPLGTDPAPGVVVIHEALGLTEDIKGFCHRFASNGYLALAPDLFARGSMFRCLMQTFRELNQGKGQSFQDVEAAGGHLMQHPRCTGKVGVIGFCMGGILSILAAARTDDADAAVPWYGLPFEGTMDPVNIRMASKKGMGVADAAREASCGETVRNPCLLQRSLNDSLKAANRAK